MATPSVEVYHQNAQEVPEVACVVCGQLTNSQAYSLVLKREKITRRWFFCSLEHVRAWVKPI